jgi:CheY-like chemotaxis protein
MDLESLVRNLGHNVIGVARTHSDAVALAKNKKPGLILADIQLADGSSGLDAVNELLKTFEVPVVFITAYPERFLTGERPEPAFLISKPFQPAMVSAVASQALFFQRNPARSRRAGFLSAAAADAVDLGVHRNIVAVTGAMAAGRGDIACRPRARAGEDDRQFELWAVFAHLRRRRRKRLRAFDHRDRLRIEQRGARAFDQCFGDQATRTVDREGDFRRTVLSLCFGRKPPLVGQAKGDLCLPAADRIHLRGAGLRRTDQKTKAAGSQPLWKIVHDSSRATGRGNQTTSREPEKYLSLLVAKMAKRRIRHNLSAACPSSSLPMI